MAYEQVTRTTCLNDSTFQSVVDPSLLESIDPSIYFDPNVFDLGPVAEPYLQDSDEDALLKEASDSFENSTSALFTEQTSSNADALEKEYEDENKATSKFGPPVGQEYLESLREKAVPQTTQKQTKWALQRWKDWIRDRNEQRECVRVDGIAPFDLETQSDSTIAFWMERFVCEVRKKDTGDDYPPETIYALVVSLQRHIRSIGKRPEVDFFQQPAYDNLKRTLDAKMKELTEKGVKSEKKKAEIITEDMEDILWKKGLLGDHSPQVLLDTMVYCNGVYFALRSGKEHRQLRGKPCQITVVDKPHQRPYLLYQESSSKNKPAGLKGRNKPRKEVIQHANLKNPQRCPVRLFKLYQSLCPRERPDGAFYLKPLTSTQPNCWFSKVAVGWNQLQNTINRLCKEAGFSGFYTNHSLRATTASRLYANGVDEQLIMERTGHSSTTGVRNYKRTTISQLETVSDLMFAPKSPKKPKANDKENTCSCAVVTTPEQKACFDCKGETAFKERPSSFSQMSRFGNIQLSGCTVSFNFKN